MYSPNDKAIKRSVAKDISINDKSPRFDEYHFKREKDKSPGPIYNPSGYYSITLPNEKQFR